ncbi:unnamed protein product [Mesocestoides corti]|uniref:Uncharacterized protein n=1 Tax=Mesocestoides corti TaxID=53468 RepID=A0A0R3UPX2_MESCO|nr:unnamed protein product [Mesocestoides corti]
MREHVDSSIQVMLEDGWFTRVPPMLLTDDLSTQLPVGDKIRFCEKLIPSRIDSCSGALKAVTRNKMQERNRNVTKCRARHTHPPTHSSTSEIRGLPRMHTLLIAHQLRASPDSTMAGDLRIANPDNNN